MYPLRVTRVYDRNHNAVFRWEILRKRIGNLFHINLMFPDFQFIILVQFFYSPDHGFDT
jgi:hypothetical protein